MPGKGHDAFLWVSLWQKYWEEGVLQFDWKRREICRAMMRSKPEKVMWGQSVEFLERGGQGAGI